MHAAAGCPATHRVVCCYHNGNFKMVCLGCYPHMADCAVPLKDDERAVDDAVKRFQGLTPQARRRALNIILGSTEDL